MDTIGAEERIAKKRAEMMVAKDPQTVERLVKEIAHIQEMGGNMEAKLSKFKIAYDSIINSDDPLVANSHDEIISNTISHVIKKVGNTPLRNMSLYQLEAVYDMYLMVLTSVRNANKAFKVAKGAEISTIANGVVAELDKQKKKSTYANNGIQAISAFDWNNLKPVYAFERIGSANFTKVFEAVRAGEDVWAKDMSEAAAFREEQRKKHRWKGFDLHKKYAFVDSRGKKFTLCLEQIMSIYAYYKRGDDAKNHLKNGGFQFDKLTKIKEKKGKVIEVTYQLNDPTIYRLSDELLFEIVSVLDTVEGAKDFVDEMQEYLSSVMGEKGNEVSLTLYGVKLFKEKNYFPLRVSKEFLDRENKKVRGEVKIKNSGFTNAIEPEAQNTVILTPFMDTWANHVHEMSMYHAFVLPLEDFDRVYKYKMDDESVNMYLKKAHGDAATQYIDQLIKDLNGGAGVYSTVGTIDKMTRLFKKAAVLASASVAIQQGSTIARATALVDIKYFYGKSVKGRHNETWAEIKKYAPVAIIKEMGHFDTGMGKSAIEWLMGEKTWNDKVDDITSKFPALADEYTWCAIWNAVKRETLHTHPKLLPNSEEFLNVVGERFTEVIIKTQVYDSVLSRSANMRSKDTGMKMATAFMGEATTSLNMLENAIIQGKRGNTKYAHRAVGSVIASIILNAILVSIVYAGRDDDEDKTYTEKYIGTLTEELLDSINPLALVPFIRDIVSISQGYDVERSDMAVITDIINAWNNLGNDNRSVYRKVEDFAGGLAALFGLPVKNIMRDARGMYNTINSFINGHQTTSEGIKTAIEEGITGKDKSNSQELYEAILSGDVVHIERVKSRFKDQKSIDSAIRKALRDNDSRIKEIAMATISGNDFERSRIQRTIVAEGHFEQELIIDAIDAEVKYVRSKLKEAKEHADNGEDKEYQKIYNSLVEMGYSKEFLDEQITLAIREIA